MVQECLRGLMSGVIGIMAGPLKMIGDGHTGLTTPYRYILHCIYVIDVCSRKGVLGFLFYDSVIASRSLAILVRVVLF